MKEVNNIDNFFKKRLDRSTFEEADWNVPNEDIWNAAQPNFPKEKKRRRFIFWFFGLAIAGLTIFIWNPFSSATFYPQKINGTQSQSENATPNTNSISNSINNNENQNTLINSDSQLPIKTREEKSSTTGNTIPSIPEESQNKTITKEISNSVLPIQNSKNQINTFNLLHDLKNNKPPLEFAEKAISEYQQIIDENNGNSSAVAFTQSIANKGNNFQATAEVPAIKDHALTVSERAATALPLTTLVLLNTNRKQLKMPSITLLDVITKRPIHKWEIGASYAPFILNPFTASNSDLETNKEFRLTSTYTNVNLHVTKRISSKFSLSSGVYYSSLDVNLNFDFQDEYDALSNETNIKDQIKDHASLGSLQINDASSEFNITFNPSANVMDGDLLHVVSKIPIQLEVIQIPILLNYHIRRKKLDWFLQGGISLDLINAKINNLELDIFKDGQLANNPIEFNAVEDDALGLSVYAGGGLKYYIGNHFNIGVAAKLDLAGIVFSRYDIGLFYGF